MTHLVPCRLFETGTRTTTTGSPSDCAVRRSTSPPRQPQLPQLLLPRHLHPLHLSRPAAWSPRQAAPLLALRPLQLLLRRRMWKSHPLLQRLLRLPLLPPLPQPPQVCANADGGQFSAVFLKLPCHWPPCAPLLLADATSVAASSSTAVLSSALASAGAGVGAGSAASITEDVPKPQDRIAAIGGTFSLSRDTLFVWTPTYVCCCFAAVQHVCHVRLCCGASLSHPDFTKYLFTSWITVVLRPVGAMQSP